MLSVLINCKSCFSIMNGLNSNANKEMSFYTFVVPGFFLVDSFDKANSQFTGFGFFGRSALGCRNGYFRYLG